MRVPSRPELPVARLNIAENAREVEANAAELVPPEGAPRVAAMTKPQGPIRPGQTCPHCPHPFDYCHFFALVPVHDPDAPPMGLTLCEGELDPDGGEPVPCGCVASWCASTGPSTPEQIQYTRMLLRDALALAGLPVPRILR
jgi:hypothetical protein